MSETTRDLIDELAERKALGPARVRQYFLRVCDAIDSIGDSTYSELLALGRRCARGDCTADEMREGRIRAVLARDACSKSSPRQEGAFRVVRYLLEDPETRESDWYDVLWNFVDDAQNAGLTDATLAGILQDVFPELIGAARGRNT